MEFLNAFVSEIGVLGYAIIGINLVLLFFAKHILTLLVPDEEESVSFKRKLMVFRALNILMIIAYGYVRFYHPAISNDVGVGLGYKFIASLAILYIAYLFSNLARYYIVKQYGKQREIKGVLRWIPTYQTRLLGIFGSVFIGIIAMISIIRVLEFDSLLEAGGIIGIIGVMLALTQSSWAPDIFSGLILLNSDMMQEGDVILIKGSDPVYGLIYKTKVFHTVVLNLTDNHRIMIRNAKLRDFTIHNLSKFASAKGLRERLVFKVGYDVDLKKVDKMFSVAVDKIINSADAHIEIKHGLEYVINDAGDYAVEWFVYYYTKNVDKLINTRQILINHILQTANAYKISLATPLMHTVNNSQGVL